MTVTSKAVIYALASALLFGISTPAAKLLVGTVHPAILAGLLYCGAGGGIAIYRRIIVISGQGVREVPLSRSQLPWLAGAICAGGIAGPLFLMAGLARTGAATSSLLLTLEAATTAIIAWLVFHESFDRRIALGMIFLVVGAATLGWSGTPSLDSVAGPLLIAGACLAWGVDNNLTRKVSLSDPLQVVQIKGLVAGPFNLALGTRLAGHCRTPRQCSWLGLSDSSDTASVLRCSCSRCVTSERRVLAHTFQLHRSLALPSQ